MGFLRHWCALPLLKNTRSFPLPQSLRAGEKQAFLVPVIEQSIHGYSGKPSIITKANQLSCCSASRHHRSFFYVNDDKKVQYSAMIRLHFERQQQMVEPDATASGTDKEEDKKRNSPGESCSSQHPNRKSAKREWLAFKGRKVPRVGHDFQVSNLPPMPEVQPKTSDENETN